MNTIKPYSDEHMIYSENSGRYVLTQKAILDRFGINLLEEAKKDAYPEISVNAILDTVSTHVYNFIYDHSVHNDFQRACIDHLESARSLVYEAMLKQFIYVKAVGDLSKSTDPTRRALWFDSSAEKILMRVLPETGRSLLYCGV